jgi:protein TonB
MNPTMELAVIKPADRLGLTICFAIIVHAMMIFGVSFTSEDTFDAHAAPIEVMLVHERSSKDSAEADFLAQANLEGGGDHHEKIRPAAPLAAPFPDDRAEIVMLATPPERATPAQPAPIANEQPTEAAPENEPTDGSASLQRTEELAELVAKAPAVEKPIPARVENPKPQPEKPEQRSRSEPTARAPAPDAATLIANSLAIASLNAEIDQRLEARAKRPRLKFVSASTREYKFASYMEAWRAKVERIGNLNYPEEARKNRLTGNLLLDVALKPDGSVSDITIRRPSGFRVLDEAAIRIVRLSAPFAPFPEAISRDVDVLHITRSWQFLNSYRFASH